MSVQCWGILVWTGLGLRALSVQNQSMCGCISTSKPQSAVFTWLPRPWTIWKALKHSVCICTRTRAGTKEERMPWKGAEGKWRVGLGHPLFRTWKLPWFCNPSHKKKIPKVRKPSDIKCLGCFIEHFTGKWTEDYCCLVIKKSNSVLRITSSGSEGKSEQC